MYNDYKNKPLFIRLPNVRAYAKIYDGETTWMYFLIEDDDLLEKYNTIWDKLSSDIEPVYNKKILKTKIKSYDDEITDFSDKEILKVGSDYTCLAVIIIDSVS